MSVKGFLCLLMIAVILPGAAFARGSGEEVASDTGVAGDVGVAGGDRSWYHVTGFFDLLGEAAHLRDSPATLNPDDRDTWMSRGYGELSLRHTLEWDRGIAVIDHAALVFPALVFAGGGGTGAGAGAGTGGSGAGAVADVSISHELFEAYVLTRATPWMAVAAGRQFLWGGQGVARTSPGGLFFSVTDGIHPRARTAEAQPGFDGLRIQIGGEGPLQASAAVAIQDAHSPTGDPDDDFYEKTRVGFNAWVEGAMDTRLGLTWVGQNEVLQRGGIFVVTAPGAFTLAVEAAVETLDPRERIMASNFLVGVRGGYEISLGPDWDAALFAEYHHNGLAAIYPDDRTRVAVTSDGASGFLRPDRHYGHYGFMVEQGSTWRTTHVFITNLSSSTTLAEHELRLLALAPARAALAVQWTSGAFGTEFGNLPRDFLVRISAGIGF